MKATQAMTRDVVFIHANDSLQAAQDIMNEWEFRHLPVVEGEKLIGIISDRDLLLYTHVDEDGVRALADLEVGEVMARKPVTCSPSYSIARIAAMMTERKIDCLPVVEDDGELTGLITSTDLIELLKEKDMLDSSRVVPWSYQLRLRDVDGYGKRHIE